MDEHIPWIQYQLAFGCGTAKSQKLLGILGSPFEIFHCTDERLKGEFGLEPAEIARIRSATVDEAKKVLNFCNRNSCRVLTMESEEYPRQLRNIFGPPAVLYCRGSLEMLEDSLAIAVVGTRKATPYGRKVTAEIAEALAARGVVIVGGLAVGIDSEGHKAALRRGGKTIAVMATGIDHVYPAENAALADAIVRRGGAVITEMLPGVRGRGYHFPIRNRIISGLCHGVLIGEAPRRSGALITAGHALSQNRDVFAIPGNIDSPNSGGCNWLISEGAKLISSAEDILVEYDHLQLHEPAHVQLDQMSVPDRVMRKNAESRTAFEERLTETQRMVYEILDSTPVSSDELMARCTLPVGKVLAALTQLEIFGMINVYPGRLFSR